MRHSSVYHVHWGCGFLACQCIHNWSCAGDRQLRPAARQRETADPCRTRLELTQMRTLHCNRGPWGNLGRTLSASLLLCSIWKGPATCSGRPSRPSSASFFYSQVCLFTLPCQTRRTSHRHLDGMWRRNMGQAPPSVFVWSRCVLTRPTNEAQRDSALPLNQQQT